MNKHSYVHKDEVKIINQTFFLIIFMWRENVLKHFRSSYHRRGRMIVGFTSTCAVMNYHKKSCGFDTRL
jgi:hypothetical protein